MIMKCSLKDIFVNILFTFIIIIIIIISPSKGVEYPLFIPRDSVLGNPMNLQELRASINRLQDLDSFPINSQNQLHKIVKKQMTTCDYNERKNKRSIFVIPERLKSFGFDNTLASDIMAKGDGNGKLFETPAFLKPRYISTAPNYESYLTKLSQFAKNSGIQFSSSLEGRKKKKSTGAVEKQEPQNTPNTQETSQQMEQQQQQEINQVLETTMKPTGDSQVSVNNAESTKVAKNQVASKEMKEKQNQQIPEINYQQWPYTTVEEKIQEYLSEKRLPEIVIEAEETEDNIKQFKNKNKIKNVTGDEKEEKELKENKETENDKKKTEEYKETKDEKELKEMEKKEKELQDKPSEEVKKLSKADEEKKRKEDEKMLEENPNLKKDFRKFPDRNDYRYYYECEAHPNGCLKLRHKRCPQGQFFSFKFLKCLKIDNKKEKEYKQEDILKRQASFDSSSRNFAHENEWLDASQDYTTTIPTEFQSTTEPDLRIYHLQKRKLSEMADNVEPDCKYNPKGTYVAHNDLQNPLIPHDGTTKKHHSPRSYIIRIKKKEGKNQITESNEIDNANDEDDQDSEEEDDEEEVDDEDEENEEEEEDIKDESKKGQPSGQSLKDLFRAAKTAVTNRAKFEDPTLAIAMNGGSKMTRKKTEADSENQNKKVLIDANIKVDSTIGSVLKSLIKSKPKESSGILTWDEEALISDRGSQDQMDPELLRMYEHLMRSNPRVKRYFLSNRFKKKTPQR